MTTLRDDLPPVLTRKDFDSDEEYQEYLDIENAEDGDDFTPVTDAQKQDLKAWADNVVSGERARVAFMIPKRNLSRLKARALEEGLPYQTLLNAIIQRYLSRR